MPDRITVHAILMGWLLLLTALVPAVAQNANPTDVVAVARTYADGGKHNAEFQGSGTPEEIRFKDQRILSKGDGTYCSGFTFAVVMKAAEARGLLTAKSVEEVRQFQQNWYGNTDESREKQCAYALEKLGIGKGVALADARPGDFIQFWRAKTGYANGHSVVFLGWIEEGGKKVGIRYRSSQSKELQGTQAGVGDAQEFFSDVTGKSGTIIRERAYAARLNSP